MTVREQEIQGLRERLVSERERVTSEIEGLREAAVQYTASVADEDRSYGNHLADDATNTFEQEQQLALLRTLDTVLQEIDSALQRMDEGTYGVCVDCGQPIPIERLEARPYAMRCVADQEKEDRRR